MKTPAKLAPLLLTLLALVPLTACKKLGLPPVLPHGGHPAGVDLSPADVAMQAKLQPVIHCINRTFSHYEDIQANYEKRVAQLTRNPSDSGLSDFFEFSIEPYERNHEFATECATGLDKAITLSPADPAIDRPAQDAAQAIRAILQPGGEMDAYLQQKAYLGDNFTRGRTLAATLTPLLSRIVADGEKLRLAVHQQELALRQHELDAIDKAEGHSLQWHTHKNLIEARALNDNIVSLVRTRQLTPATVATAIQPLQQAYTDTETYLAQHPEAARPNRYNNQPVWFSIKTDISIELGAANELRSVLADNSFTPETKRERVNAQLQQVTNDFNGLIQSYNLMEQNRLAD